MRRLCYGGLHFHIIHSCDEIICGVRDKKQRDVRFGSFDGLVLDSAVYLNNIPVVKQLFGSAKLCDHSRTVERKILEMTAYHGHLEIFQYLFPNRDTTYERRLCSEEDLILSYLRIAGVGGSSRMFNYLLDLFTTTSFKNLVQLIVWDQC